MEWILALITYFGWGSGDIFGIYATRKVGSYLTAAYIFIFGFLISSLYLPFALGDISKITPFLFILNVIAGLLYLIGNFLIAEAFRISSASLVGIIIQAFPAVVLVLSAIIFKDVITPKQSLWIILIFVGIFFCSVDFNDFKNGKLFSDKGVRLALIAALILSLFFTFFRVFSNSYGWFLPNYIAFATFPLALFIVKRIFKYKEKIIIPKEKSVIVATFLTALLIRGADISLNYGLANGFTSVVAPISSAAPTLFIFLSSIFFKDPITKQQKIGIGVCLLGIVLLSFFSN